MILKFRTFKDDSARVWNFVDGIEEAHVIHEKISDEPCIDIRKKDGTTVKYVLYDEAYLLNDYGVTIERLHM